MNDDTNDTNDTALKYKNYAAVMANDSRIITVLAFDEASAIRKIDEQLNRNPSRFAFYVAWMNDGHLVKEVER